METCLFVVILFLYWVCLASNYPSKPLNERSLGITWEAWLLIDDQNQNKQIMESLGLLGKRITAKSIFIAPNFNPQYLPACGAGSSLDSMGRCIKIIKLDQDAHYEFLIERLKEKFSPDDYDYYDEEYSPTAGPLQVNIPLHIKSGGTEIDEIVEESDIAIILSPTKTHFDSNILNLDKRNSKDDEYEIESSQKNKASSIIRKKSGLIGLMMEDKNSISNRENVTEFEEPSKTFSLDQSIHEVTDEDSSMPYRLDLEFEGTTHPKKIVVRTTDDPLFTRGTRLSASTPRTDISPYVFNSKRNFSIEMHVRFLGSDDPLKSQISSPTKQISNSHQGYIDEDSGESGDHMVFSGVRTLVSDEEMYKPLKMSHKILPRKNDGRFNGIFRPRWAQNNSQKPLLMFSKSNINTDQFKNQQYCRFIPTKDLSYLFKFKHS